MVHILGPERRRRWTAEQKRAIVAAAFAPGAVVAEVARHADVCAGQIYRWRRDLGMGPADFTEVVMVPPLAPPVSAGSDSIELVLADWVGAVSVALRPLVAAMAAEQLGISRKCLWEKMRRYGIAREQDDA